jgi:hypothetical protein
MSRKRADFYCQCSLKSPTAECYTVSYIPAQYAIPNKLLSLKTNDIWEDWIVQSAGPPHPAKLVEAHSDDWRKWFDNDI